MGAETATSLPVWFTRMASAIVNDETRFFILHGDVDGYVSRTQPPRQFLRSAMARPLQDDPKKPGYDPTPRIVVRYDLASNIRFLDDDQPPLTGNDGRPITGMRARATAALAGASPATPPPASGMAAALAQLNPAAGGGSPDPFGGTSKLGCLRAIGALLAAPSVAGQVRVVIDEADKIMPAGDVATMTPEDRTVLVLLKTWARELMPSGNVVALITGDLQGLHSELRAASSGWRSIEIAMPDEAARLRWIEYYLALVTGARLDGMDAAGMARLTAGLSLRNVEDIMLAAGEEAVTGELVMERKAEIIRAEYSEVARMIEPLPNGLDDLGGMQAIKDWFREEIVRPIKEGRPKDAKRGVVLVGPPGTGKTMLVAGLAGSVDMNCVALDTSRIQDSLVGASERNLDKFFRFAVSLEPTIIFIDEIDQSDMGSRGNSSGNPVAKNLFGMLLQFMSRPELAGKVIVVLATNRPDLLDPALIRSQRIDAIIPVLLPERDDRELVAAKRAVGRGVTVSGEACATIANGSDRYSAADVASVIDKAIDLSRRAGGGGAIDADHAALALRFYRPNTLAKADEYTKLALDACNDLELLPAAMREAILAAKLPQAVGAPTGAPAWEAEGYRRGMKR